MKCHPCVVPLCNPLLRLGTGPIHVFRCPAFQISGVSRPADLTGPDRERRWIFYLRFAAAVWGYATHDRLVCEGGVDTSSPSPPFIRPLANSSRRFDAAPPSPTAALHRTGWSEFPAHPRVYAFNKLIDRAAGKLSCYRLAHEFALMTGALTHLVAGGPCRALLATVFSGKFNEAAKGFTPQNTRMVFQRDPNGAFAPALCCHSHPPSAPVVRHQSRCPLRQVRPHL